MDLKENIKIYQNFTGKLIGPDGRVKRVVRVKNKVVDVGLEHLADQLLDSPTQTKMSHYAVGTDNTAPVAGDTTLKTEIARVALNGKSRVSKKTVYNAAFLPGVGTGTLWEGGIFNNASGGVMLARIVLPSGVVKGAADTFIVNHEIIFAAA